MRGRRSSSVPDLPVPKRPYRDTVLVYAALSVALVGVAYLTGGGLIRALVVAAIFFVVATGWTWLRFRARLREEERERVSGQARAGSNGGRAARERNP